jgi:hypothetical protein
MRNFFINLGLLLTPLLLLEAAFRFLPVAYLPRIETVNESAPMARFQPNVDFRWSRDWNFSVVTRKHTNNYGFVSAIDYRPDERTPLLAIVGDSLVEANQVNAGQSVGEVLHAALGGKGRVYSFAISGAPLSQYLAYAEYARKEFRADSLAIVVAPNDFDESLLKYKSEPRLHYFAEDGTLQRLDYEISSTRKFLRQSAVLRYAMQNLNAGLRVDALLQSMRGSGIASAQSPEALERRLADSYRAVEYFLDQLPEKSGLGPKSIVFVLDPLRPAVYSPEGRAHTGKYYGRILAHFAAQAAARGYELIDLEPVFLRRHQLDGTRFEVASNDSHWSALGHQVVAEEVEKSAVYKRSFSELSRFRSVSARRAD